MKRFTGFFLSSILMACVLRASPVDLTAPKGTLGAASSEGYVLIYREIDEVDYGNDLKLPIRIQFKSRPGENSEYLGSGWKIPMLESTCGLYQEGMMRAELPCGRRLWLYSRKRGSQEFQTLDQEWTGKLEDKTFMVSRADGWEIKYIDGKLITIKTDTGRVIQWIYENKKVTGVSEAGNIAFRVILDPQGRMTGISVNDRKHQVELGQKPRVKEVAGQKLVEALDPTLVKWIFPDGKTEEFEFAVDAERLPTLNQIDQEKKTELYTWDPATGYILGQGDWKYSIGKKEGKFDLPTLSRTNSKGLNEEISSDNKIGMITKIGSDGVKTVTYKFKAPGALFNKVQKIEKITDSGTSLIYAASYDEAGRLLRRTDEKGFVSLYEYAQSGKRLFKGFQIPRSASYLSEMKAKEKSLWSSLESAKREDDINSARQMLGLFFAKDMLDSRQALEIASKINNPMQRFNVKLALISNDPAISNEEKIKQFEVLKKEYPPASEIVNKLIQDRKG